MDLIIHEEIAVEAVRVLESRRDVDGHEERRLLTIGNGGRSIELEVQLTPTAVAVARNRGYDLDELIQERALWVAASYPNDGQKLDRLEAISPLAIGSNLVPD
jgi:hypothetical protein